MASTNGAGTEGTYFEQQRALLINDVAAVLLIRLLLRCHILTTLQSLESVLQNINKLNRSLEGVIAVRLSPYPITDHGR